MNLLPLKWLLLGQRALLALLLCVAWEGKHQAPAEAGAPPSPQKRGPNARPHRLERGSVAGPHLVPP